MKILLLVLVCLFVSAKYDVNGQEFDECVIPGGGVGICKLISDCEDAAKKYTSINTLPPEKRIAVKQELLDITCGTVTTVSPQMKVCCSDCVTPHNKKGVKKHIKDCTHLAKMLHGSSGTDISFAKASRLDGVYVCCGENRCDSIVSTISDASGKCCGVDSSSSSRIIGGRATDIHEYPWAVLLEYEKNEKIELWCGGSLISNRFVVTAAHCISGGGAFPPKNVRVGEYNTGKIGKDCVNFPDGTQKCTDGPLSIPIEWYRLHPEYNFTDKMNNDIAVIKLKFPVKYTDFVRPICLPSSYEPTATTLFHATGWGKLGPDSTFSPIKQTVKLNLYTGVGSNGKTCTEKICAGGVPGQDTCKGDSGGPLMLQITNGGTHFTLAGVTSFGGPDCGTSTPGIYTKVTRYVDWIRQIVT